MIEIRHCVSHAPMWTSNALTVADAVSNLVARGVSLANSNLGSRNLMGAQLKGADLRGAVLHYSDLTNANLEGANLEDAILKDVKLTGANLKNVRGLPHVPRLKNLHRRVSAAVGRAGCRLDMDYWHSTECKTTHCRAGWVITLAGEAGRALEKAVGSSMAGALIYFRSTGEVPDFYANDEAALANIRRAARREREKEQRAAIAKARHRHPALRGTRRASREAR